MQNNTTPTVCTTRGVPFKPSGKHTKQMAQQRSREHARMQGEIDACYGAWTPAQARYAAFEAAQQRGGVGTARTYAKGELRAAVTS